MKTDFFLSQAFNKQLLHSKTLKNYVICLNVIRRPAEDLINKNKQIDSLERVKLSYFSFPQFLTLYVKICFKNVREIRYFPITVVILAFHPFIFIQ